MYLFYILAGLCASCCLRGLKVQILQCHKVAVLAVFLYWLERRRSGNLTKKPSVRLCTQLNPTGKWRVRHSLQEKPCRRGAARMVLYFPSRSWNFEGRPFQTGELMQGLSTGPGWLSSYLWLLPRIKGFKTLTQAVINDSLWARKGDALEKGWEEHHLHETIPPVISQIITKSICFPHSTASPLGSPLRFLCCLKSDWVY